ncbi:DUF6731 family protein [Aquimarina algiphila]|uniref:DUF6731 family protein n=1 Tax=Aquimarina algiphila TaxID=2047982 RepID=UPI0023313EF7|nr:DUF6731 family protein [Aquimarina algiphila]
MAKKYKETSVYYYQISPHLTKADDEEVRLVKKRFKKAFKFRGKLKIIKQGEGSVSAIKGKVINDRYIGGAVIYTQESNLPPKMDDTGTKTEELQLEGFKGLGYDSAYFYDTETMVLAIESRVPGVTLAALQALIYRNQEINTFDFKPVASVNDYNRFLESEGVTSMEMEVLNLNEKPKKNAPVKGVEETIKLVEDTNGSKININISSGRNKLKVLDKKYLKNMIDYALQSIGGQNEISKFKLNIIDVDSGKVVPIDLISGRIKGKTKIEKVRAIDKFSIAEKIKQMEGSYLRKRQNIEEMIKL